MGDQAAQQSGDSTGANPVAALDIVGFENGNPVVALFGNVQGATASALQVLQNAFLSAFAQADPATQSRVRAELEVKANQSGDDTDAIQAATMELELNPANSSTAPSDQPGTVEPSTPTPAPEPASSDVPPPANAPAAEARRPLSSSRAMEVPDQPGSTSSTLPGATQVPIYSEIPAQTVAPTPASVKPRVAPGPSAAEEQASVVAGLLPAPLEPIETPAPTRPTTLANDPKSPEAPLPHSHATSVAPEDLPPTEQGAPTKSPRFRPSSLFTEGEDPTDAAPIGVSPLDQIASREGEVATRVDALVRSISRWRESVGPHGNVFDITDVFGSLDARRTADSPAAPEEQELRALVESGEVDEVRLPDGSVRYEARSQLMDAIGAGYVSSEADVERYKRVRQESRLLSGVTTSLLDTLQLASLLAPGSDGAAALLAKAAPPARASLIRRLNHELGKVDMPGTWENTGETMSEASANYQSKVTRVPAGASVRVGKVKFDGVDTVRQVYLDAKAGFGRFLREDGSLQPWFYDAASKMLKQARKQADAVEGYVVEWVLDSPEFAAQLRQGLEWAGIREDQLRVVVRRFDE